MRQQRRTPAVLEEERHHKRTIKVRVHAVGREQLIALLEDHNRDVVAEVALTLQLLLVLVGRCVR